ncbi:MAG: acetate kinase [Actinobacteria bacterium]|nr:acetate kinase [Actinomycetota bacterium]
MTGTILVFNAGSSSVKYELIDSAVCHSLASGLVERVGHDDAVIHHRVGDTEITGPVAAVDHTSAVRAVIDAFATHGPALAEAGIGGVGHRVVMGGEMFAPTLITDDVLAAIDALAPLAPLHNPANAATIRVARELLADVPHVAVFDTAFFHDLPAPAAHYAIDPTFATEHAIRRYGFHGISHEYVSGTVTAHLGDRGRPLRQIVLHLGNGASASAVVGGCPVETSMGLTPLEGLVMGTRSGDIDPAVAFYLHRELGMDIDAIDHLLNYGSGLAGMTGTNDVRDIQARITNGDAAARAAMDIYVHRLVKYVGAYSAVMGGVDALAFTAGVGEHDAVLRAQVCAPLGFLGIAVDAERNARAAHGAESQVISPDEAPVRVLVVPTREEHAIARQVTELLS